MTRKGGGHLLKCGSDASLLLVQKDGPDMTPSVKT